MEQSGKSLGGIMSDACVSENMQEIFLRCTHINVHIIACLRARKALDKFQVSQLSGEKSLIKRCQMVFEWIEHNQSFHELFCQIMKENGQEHVSNLLKGSRKGPHIPLSQPRYNRLESITPKLMLIIRNDEEFVAILRAKDAISEIDRQDIMQVSKEYKRNWNLIEAILRRSDYAFDCFEQALRETLQDNAANYLHEGQVIAVHANTTQPDKDEVMSELINKTILEESKGGPSSQEKILKTFIDCNIHPVLAKPGQSIIIFFYCKTIDDIIKFTELFSSGDLQQKVENIMNRLLLKVSPEDTENLKTRLSCDEEEDLVVEKFSGIADWMPAELEELVSGSRILCNVETPTEQQLEDKDSIVYDVPKFSASFSNDSDYIFWNRDLESKLTVTEKPTLSTTTYVELNRDEDPDYMFWNRDLESKLTVTEKPTLSTTTYVELNRVEESLDEYDLEASSSVNMKGMSHGTQESESLTRLSSSSHSDKGNRKRSPKLPRVGDWLRQKFRRKRKDISYPTPTPEDSPSHLVGLDKGKLITGMPYSSQSLVDIYETEDADAYSDKFFDYCSIGDWIPKKFSEKETEANISKIEDRLGMVALPSEPIYENSEECYREKVRHPSGFSLEESPYFLSQDYQTYEELKQQIDVLSKDLEQYKRKNRELEIQIELLIKDLEQR